MERESGMGDWVIVYFQLGADSEELGDAKCIPDTGHPEISEAPSTRASRSVALCFSRRRGNGNDCSSRVAFFAAVAKGYWRCDCRSAITRILAKHVPMRPCVNVAYSRSAFGSWQSPFGPFGGAGGSSQAIRKN